FRRELLSLRRQHRPSRHREQAPVNKNSKLRVRVPRVQRSLVQRFIRRLVFPGALLFFRPPAEPGYRNRASHHHRRPSPPVPHFSLQSWLPQNSFSSSFLSFFLSSLLLA